MTLACQQCGLLHPAGTPCFALTLPGATSARGLQSGIMLAGRYRIEQAIHRGGMSMVYLAEDTVQNRMVALKELRLPESASQEEVHEAEAWFARESHLLSILQHPLIPRFYSVFRENERSYIVQEYVAGENLEQLVDEQGPVDPDTLLTWAGDLCDLLTYLHTLPEPVVFRDLKPANILLRETSRTLAVVDFGIARPYQAGQVGTVVGTPGYAPPEQYQGLATPQSDVYALGATLHRLLTGFDPEQSGAPFVFPPVQTLNPDVPAGLAEVVERALCLNPSERFASAAHMSAALRKTRLRAVGSTAGRPARASTHRRMWPVIAVAVLVSPLLLRVVAAEPRPPLDYSSTPMLTSPLQLLGASCPAVPVQATVPGRSLAPDAGITTGADGTLWFAEQDMTALNYLAPSGQMASCALPGISAPPRELVAGDDGSLWFTEQNGDSIGRITPDGQIAEYTVPAGTGAPDQAAVGADGSLWFTQPSSNHIGRITSTGTIEEFRLPRSEAGPAAITLGPDNALWFTESTNRIGRLTPQGAVSGFPLPGKANAGLTGITTGHDGDLWFTDGRANEIGRLTLTGTASEVPVPTRNAGPTAIIAGPDGSYWFTEPQANNIGRITPDGRIAEFPIPTPASQPAGITAGQDGNIWFTEAQGRQLGRVDPDGAITEFPAVAGVGYDMADGQQVSVGTITREVVKTSSSIPNDPTSPTTN